MNNSLVLLVLAPDPGPRNKRKPESICYANVTHDLMDGYENRALTQVENVQKVAQPDHHLAREFTLLNSVEHSSSLHL